LLNKWKEMEEVGEQLAEYAETTEADEAASLGQEAMR
jgi:hypothetical protein